MKDRIENKSYNDTQYTRKNKKHKIISTLQNKMDLIKREVYKTFRGRTINKVYFDFEKKISHNENTNVVYVRDNIYKEPVLECDAEKIMEGAISKVTNTHEYMWDIRTLPIYKILRDSRKLVLYDEWIYCMRENDCIKMSNEIIRERKRNHVVEVENVFFSEEEVFGIMKKYVDNKLRIVEQICKLNKDVKKYFDVVDRYFPSRMCLKRKNMAQRIYSLYNNKEGSSLNTKSTTVTNNTIPNPSVPPPNTSGNLVSKYRKMINIYKKCTLKTSLYYKFKKLITSTNTHQSFTSILKKLPVERGSLNSVKDLGKALYVRQNDVDYENSTSSDGYTGAIFGEKPEKVEDLLGKNIDEFERLIKEDNYNTENKIGEIKIKETKIEESRSIEHINVDPYIDSHPPSMTAEMNIIYPFDVIHSDYVSENYLKKDLNIVENSLFVDSVKNEQINLFSKIVDDLDAGNVSELSSIPDEFPKRYMFEDNETLKK